VSRNILITSASGFIRAALVSRRDSKGHHVVHWRLGIVLARHSGAAAKLLPSFRLGLGGRLGTGRQYWVG
jgi:NAD dependent epimerase/dehydratase family enzyme